MWRKSSYSSNGTSCVELRADLRAVRDSKNAAGPFLSADLRALVDLAKRA